MTKKSLYYLLGSVFLVLAIAGTVIAIFSFNGSDVEGTIKVGIFDEEDFKDAELLAMAEVNNAGGLIGKKIVHTLLNPEDMEQADKLIESENLVALFGCATLSCRKQIIPILAKHNILLFTPSKYSVLYQSPFMFSTSATPNQQVIPAVAWGVTNYGPKVFLLGELLHRSPAVEQAVIVQYVKDIAHAFNGHLVGERYLTPGDGDTTDDDAAVQAILSAKPDIIINLLNGKDSSALFNRLREAGLSTEKTPSMSLNITEKELAECDLDSLISDYVTQNFFQSTDTTASSDFVAAFKKMYGEDRYVNSPMANAYIGFYFWSMGVEEAQTVATDNVKSKASVQALVAPEGVISIDKATQYIWKPVLIGRIFPKKQFGIVWDSVSTVQPLKNVTMRTAEQWQVLLTQWQKEFGSEQ